MIMTPEAELPKARHGNGYKDRTGQRHHRLVALRTDGYSDSGNQRHVKWLFRCDCGKEVSIPVNRLPTKHSCGCLRTEKSREIMVKMHYRHGEAKNGQNSAEYRTWKGIISRCSNSDDPRYKDYAGRGVTVCDEWKDDYLNFLRDMGRRPRGTTIERKDNDLGYSKENCRWATPLEQGRNKRNNIWIKFRGETLHVAEWSRRTGIKFGTIHARLRRGWSPEKALSV